MCKSERYYRRIFNSDTKGDVEKARTFVESDKEFNKLNEKTDDAEAKAMLSAITKPLNLKS